MNKSRLAVVIGMSALASVWTIHFAASHIPQVGSIGGHTIPATHGPTALVRSLRPIYPYSVIAGGAYSPGELEFAHSKDPVVRSHYADFNVGRARMVVLTDDRFEYVSYRLKSQVYWTKKKLRIPKGELLLTDGTSYARARCGNRLSDRPHQAAINQHEPDAAQLSLPPVTAEMLPNMELANAPALGAVPVANATPEVVGTGAVPAPAAETPASGWPPLPGQSVIASGAIPGGSFISAGSTGSSGSPGSPAKPNTPTTPLPPSEQPAVVSPVPEPKSIYLFLISLAVSTWVLLRINHTDKTDNRN